MKFIFCSLLCLASVFAHATIVFSDAFNYADGALTNSSLWLEHSTGTQLMVSSGQALITSAAGEDVHAALTNQPFSVGSGTTLYASFTVKFTALPTSAGTYFAHYNTSNFRGLVWASINGAASGQFRLGIGNTTSATASSGQQATDLALNTTYTVVTRYAVDTGSSTLWLNPTNESDPSVTASDTAATVAISNFSLRQASGEGTLLLDNLIVGTSFTDVVGGTNQTTVTNTAPVITTQPQSQTAAAGDLVSFNVVATGTAPLNYQWRSNNVVLAGATNNTFTLTSVGTNASGSSFWVSITNAAGGVISDIASLTVQPTTRAITYLTYNVKGNGSTNWTTNMDQLQAIGREVMYLNPDVITFNEIPRTNTWQMTNFVNAFLPGYYLATNSVSDGYIRAVIASRWPITRSQSWLSTSNLANFGYTNGNSTVTRDLFEAQIAVPGFPQPLHVFVAHLKATTSGGQDDADKRAAEASCISNYFVSVFLTSTNQLHPYILSGDMNEDVFRPETSTYVTGQPIQRMTSAPTGLRLTTPTNYYDLSTSNDMTESIQATRLSVRFDYILPCNLLYSNITSSQVFRTDKLPVWPSNLYSNDDRIASDHLPVVMNFANPYTQPFRVTSFSRTNPVTALQWDAVPGGIYRVEQSSDLLTWMPLATNLVATNYSLTFTSNTSTDSPHFFRVRTQ